jgi:AAA domain-containing protein
VSLIDASRLNTAPLIYMIEDILPENGAGFFWGPSGSGKTFTILAAALDICNSRPFMGHTTLPGTVAYICGEGQGGLGIRVKGRVLRQRDDDKEAIAEVERTQGSEAAASFAASLPPYTNDNLKVMTNPFPMHFTGGGKPNEDLEKAMTELRGLNSPPPDATEEEVASWPFLRLVCLDALENFAGQLSVSHRSSANRIIATMQWMAAELQCCVLAVAHPVTAPGGGQKMVGSDRLFAAADFVIRYAPGDASAGGILNTATVSCEKSKDDTKFTSFGVELVPLAWPEPKLDENWDPIPFTDEDGHPAADPETGLAWVTEEVTSQTVRLIDRDTSAASKTPVHQAVPSPVLRDNRPVSRIRPILRPEPKARPGLHAVPDLPVPVPASAVAPREERPLDARVSQPLTALAANPDRLLYFARVILARECRDCSRPAQAGCKGKAGTYLLGHSPSGGELRAHEDRVLTAAEASPDPDVFLEKALALFPLSPVMPPVPAAPEPAPAAKPVMSERDRRLSWTTVRPDSPAPTLAQVFARG